jgi:hypothetical protein
MQCERCEKPIIENDVDEFTYFKKKSFMKRYAPEVDGNYCDDCYNGLKTLIDSFPDSEKRFIMGNGRRWKLQTDN